MPSFLEENKGTREKVPREELSCEFRDNDGEINKYQFLTPSHILNAISPCQSLFLLCFGSEVRI